MTVLRGLDPETGAALHVALSCDRIASVEAGSGAEPQARGYLAPGLVDLQVNGYGGHDLNAGDLAPETVSALARGLLATGVTRFLPTLITAAESALVQALGAIDAACRTDPVVAAMVPGVHVEGPFLSPEDGPRGAHPRAHIRPPDLDEVARWQAAAGGRVSMVTLSPHWEDSAGVVRAMVAMGLHVALGHSDATPEQVRAAAAAGARLSTHLGNGAAALLPRHPNLIWAQLDEDRLTATLIADGHHLPADTLRVFLRAKGPERALLVSDVTALGGQPPGLYHGVFGHTVRLGADGRIGIEGTPYLAGAARTLGDCVAVAVGLTGLPLHAVLRMATEAPARFAGGGGRLQAGERADLIRFLPGPDRLEVLEVWLAGQRHLP